MRMDLVAAGWLASRTGPAPGRPGGGAAFRGLRRKLDLLLRVAVFALAGLTIAAGAAVLIRTLAPAAAVAGPEPAGMPPVLVPPRAVWLAVNHPLQLFAVSGAAFDKLPLTYRAQRREIGEGRQDTMQFGTFGADAPYLDLSVVRAGMDAGPPATFFVELARLGAAANMAIARSDVPVALPTRFGAFATAALTLQQGAATVPCLGFRLEPEPKELAIRGFACGTPAKPVDRDALACVLDRLDLVSAGEDGGLRDFFVAAERRRGRDCAGVRPSATGSSNLWLDGDAAPPPARPQSLSRHKR